MLSEIHRRVDAKSLLFLFICGFFLWSSIFLGSICQAAELFFNAKVIRIIDGDTIEIQQEMKVRRVRIWGIDTPEWDQPYAQQAQQFTRSLLAGKEVQVLPKDVDVYGRLVAIITVDEKNISEELVRSGLAWVHIYYCHESICDTWKQMQERAVSQHLGLWNDHYPVAPWQWKKKHSR
jgi:micrococcal nuclease